MKIGTSQSKPITHLPDREPHQAKKTKLPRQPQKYRLNQHGHLINNPQKILVATLILSGALTGIMGEAIAQPISPHVLAQIQGQHSSSFQDSNKGMAQAYADSTDAQQNKDQSMSQGDHQQHKLISTIKALGEHRNFVRAIKNAELVSTLKNGHYTVFAPADDIYQTTSGTGMGKMSHMTGNDPNPMSDDTSDVKGDMSAGGQAGYAQPQSQPQATDVKAYIVQGDYSTSKLKTLITQNGGEASLTAVDGTPITISQQSNGDLKFSGNGTVGKIAGSAHTAGSNTVFNVEKASQSSYQ